MTRDEAIDELDAVLDELETLTDSSRMPPEIGGEIAAQLQRLHILSRKLETVTIDEP